MHSSNNDDNEFEAPLRALLVDLKPEARARVEGMLRRLGISGPDDSIILLIAILADFTHPTVQSATKVEDCTNQLAGILNKHLQKLAESEEVGWGQVEMLRDKILKSLIATTDDAVKSTKDLGIKIDVASKTITAATGDTKAELENKYSDLTKRVGEYQSAIQGWINSIAKLHGRIHSTMHLLRPPWWEMLLTQAAAMSIAAVVFAAILALFIHPATKEVAATWIPSPVSEKGSTGVNQPEAPNQTYGVKPPDSLDCFGGLVTVENLMLPNREGTRCLVVDVDRVALGANSLGNLVVWPREQPAPLAVQPFNLPGKPLPTP